MKKLAFALLSICVSVGAQIPSPQVPITGTIGAGGVFPLLNGGTLSISSCPHTLTYLESTAFVIKVTSTFTLSGPCTVTAPAGYYNVFVENLTSGGQNLVWGGSSGTTVTIANGSWSLILGDGSNYGSIASGSGSMTWPATAGIANYSGSNSWSASYNASNTIPANFISTLNQNTTGNAGTATALATAPTGCSGGQYATGIAANGNATCGTPSGSGTVTSFSSGNLSPLFTTSVATSTTTPAQSFSLSNAAQNAFLAGPSTGGTGAPSYRAIVPADVPTLNQNTTGNAANVTGVISPANGGTGSSTTPTSAQILIGQGSGNYAPETASGSCTISTAGVFSCSGSGTVVPAAQYSPAYYGTTGTAASVQGITPCSGLELLSTSAIPQCASSSQIQTAIGTGVYDVSGAAAAAQTAAQTYASNASNLSSGTVALARLPSSVTTPQNGTTVENFFLFGTSIPNGNGSTNPGQTSFASLLTASTTTNVLNYAIAGSLCAADVLSVFANYQPALIEPNAVFFECGENDTAPTGAQQYAVQNMYEAADAWLSIPPQNRILASNATATGTWTYDSTFPTYTPTATSSFGQTRSSIVSGSTLTYNIPSSAATAVGVTFGVGTSFTGTFTVKIDGTNVTDNCSGTTTFSSGVCSSYSTTSFYREQFTVTAGTTHTVVITTSSTAEVSSVAVDWVLPTPLSNASNVLHAAVLPSFTPYATMNTIAQTAISALHSAGVSVYYVDTVNGTPGVNATTDVSGTATTTCPATTYANHPNDCGQLHYYQTIINTLATNGISLGLQNQVGKSLSNTGVFSTGLVIQNQGSPNPSYFNAPSPAFANSPIFQSQFPYAASFYGSKTSSFGAYVALYTDGSSGNPWSGQNVFSLATNFAYTCFSAYTANANILLSASYTSKMCTDQSGNMTLLGNVTAASFIQKGNATVTATPGTGVTSVTCATATCTNQRGTYTVVGGTATTGTIATLAWTATSAAWVCQVIQNGGTSMFALGHSVATTTGFTVSSGLTIAGATFSFDYECQP